MTKHVPVRLTDVSGVAEYPQWLADRSAARSGPRSEPPCPGCAVPTDVPLCFRCQSRLYRRLELAAVLASQLPVNVVRLGRTTPYRIGGRSAEHPLPYDDAAVEAAWVLIHTLAAWADDLIARRVPYPAEPTTVELALWLAGHTLRLGMLPAAGSCYDEIGYVVGACLDVVEPSRRRIPSDPADTARGRQLYVTAAEAQRHLGSAYGITVTATRIRKWAQRGTIPRVGHYYRVGDLLDRLQEMSQW